MEPHGASATPARKQTPPQESKNGSRPVRVWIDMVADLFHFGHGNALRQAKQAGDILLVGVHPDSEVVSAKGPPVFTQEERAALVRACKWVDDVTFDAPYTTTLSTLEKFNIDFCVHGEDISVGADGRDSFEEVKKAGKFQLIKRTEGISTTDIVSRILSINLATLQHMGPYVSAEEEFAGLTSSRYIALFANSNSPTPSDVVVYVDGVFDLFNSGQVEILEKARKLGTYLMVGVFDDQVVRRRRGEVFPLIALYERCLALLSCRHVDEVFFGAPFTIKKELIQQLNVRVVVNSGDRPNAFPDEPDPFAVPKQLGIYREVENTSGVTTFSIINRIHQNRNLYEHRNKQKEAKDQVWRQQLHEQKEAQLKSNI